MQKFQKEFQSFKLGYDNQIQFLREQYELLKSESDESPSKLSETVEMTSSELNNANNTGNSHHLTFRPGLSPANEGINKVSHPLTIDTSDSNGINFDQLRMIPRGEGEV